MRSLKKISNVIFIFIPIYPLIDFFLFEIPITTIIFYSIISFVWVFDLKKSNYGMFENIIYIIIICFSSLLAFIDGPSSASGFLIPHLFTIISFSIFGLKIGNNFNEYYFLLKRMMYFFSLLIIAIFTTRLFLYNFDLTRVRANVNIYGGTTIHFSFMILLFLMKQKKDREYVFFLFFLFIHSLLFVSRTAIIFTFLWLFFDFISARFNFKKILLLLLLISSFLFVYFQIDSNQILINYLISRFSTWINNTISGDSILGTRSLIFDFTINYLFKNPIRIFFGIGPTMFRFINPWTYSDTHNLLLSVFTDTGIFSLILILYLFISSLNNTNYKKYLLLCYFYGIVVGVNLYYINVSFLVAYEFMFIMIIYIITIKKHRNKTSLLI